MTDEITEAVTRVLATYDDTGIGRSLTVVPVFASNNFQPANQENS